MSTNPAARKRLSAHPLFLSFFKEHMRNVSYALHIPNDVDISDLIDRAWKDNPAPLFWFHAEYVKSGKSAEWQSNITNLFRRYRTMKDLSVDPELIDVAHI